MHLSPKIVKNTPLSAELFPKSENMDSSQTGRLPDVIAVTVDDVREAYERKLRARGVPNRSFVRHGRAHHTTAVLGGPMVFFFYFLFLTAGDSRGKTFLRRPNRAPHYTTIYVCTFIKKKKKIPATTMIIRRIIRAARAAACLVKKRREGGKP